MRLFRVEVRIPLLNGMGEPTVASRLFQFRFACDRRVKCDSCRFRWVCYTTLDIFTSGVPITFELTKDEALALFEIHRQHRGLIVWKDSKAEKYDGGLDRILSSANTNMEWWGDMFRGHMAKI